MFFWSTKSGINSKYSLSASPTFVSEPWSVFTGRPKGSNSSRGSKVSVFVFDKKKFENYLLNYGIIKSKSSSNDKLLLQESYDILRNQVGNLAKMKHPHILGLVEPLEEHSRNFMFVTEYITGSLESVFGKRDEESNFFKGHVSEDIIIQKGILEIAQALDFIHNKADSVHLGIEPKSIFIDENLDWKVSGLGHLLRVPKGTVTSEIFLPQYDPRIPSFVHLELNYTAPEIVFDNTLSFKNDYFSLGALIYMLYAGKNLFQTENSTSQYKDEYAKFERKLASMSWDSVFNKLPANIRHCIPQLMNRDIYSRYDNINELLQSNFFQDPLLKTLNFLDDLTTKTNEEKLVFLKGLVDLLPKFPISILQRKFLTVLLDQLNQFCKSNVIDDGCIAVNVELLIKIGATLSQLTFQERVLPVITNKSDFEIILKSATVTIIENLETLKDKIKKDDFIELIAKPLLTYTFKDNKGRQDITAQEQLLDKLDVISNLLDFLTIKNFLIPLLSDLFTKTVSLTVKIACVSSFQLLIRNKNVDTDIICECILPLFGSMKTRDNRIMTQSLILFETVPQIIKNENLLVEQVLPLLWTYSLAPSLQAEQYELYCNAINRLSSEIQRTHLQSLSASTPQANLEGSNGFKTLIEPKPIKKEDQDTKEAKSVGVPAIEPKKKQASFQTSNQTPIPKKPTTQSSPIKPLQMRTGAPARGTPRTEFNYKFSTPTVADDDDFDDFVSASNTPPSTRIQTTNYGTTDARKSPIDSTARSPTLSSLPPGFSVSLQPNRKSTPPPTQGRSGSSANAFPSLI